MTAARDNANALYKAIGSAYIDGLVPGRNSTTIMGLSSGSAWVPGLSKLVSLPSGAASSFSPVASTWYYVYLTEVSGLGVIEFSTTAPAAPYAGVARTKAGDTTRRFVCAVLSSPTAGVWQDIRWTGDGFIMFLAGANIQPFRVITGGSATSPTDISLAGCIPVSSNSVQGVITIGGAESYLVDPFGKTALISYYTPGVRSFFRSIVSAARAITYACSATGSSFQMDINGYSCER